MENSMASDFRKRINDVVDYYLNNYKPICGRDKVIHDPIWGSVVYYKWEMQIIDTPLFQRLRDIHQLGMAEYTYPAARHSRYEHSLGTVAIAFKMIERLKERFSAESDSGNEAPITQNDVFAVRFAALLHDIGHCLYSHLSEQIYASMPEFEAIYKDVVESTEQKISPKPHEIFSYLIISSDSFCDFFFDSIDYPNKGNRENCRILLKKIANTVIGIKNDYFINGETVRKSYLTEILNSDFDADKLDYTQRDSHTAGIALTYGVERFLMKIVIHREETDDYTEYKLAVPEDAQSTIEELIFNRNLLYVNIYRHQKILATEDVMRDAIAGMVNTGIISHPCDFLYLSDKDIYADCDSSEIPWKKEGSEKTFRSVLDKIDGRNLPKRCLVLDRGDFISTDENFAEKIDRSVEEIKRADSVRAREILNDFGREYEASLFNSVVAGNVNRLRDAMGLGNYAAYTKVRNEWLEILCEKYKENGKSFDDIDFLDLNFVIPKLSGNKLGLCVVTNNDEIVDNDNFRYIRNWANSFFADKWRGYFYVSDSVDRKLAADAARELVCRKMNMISTFDIGKIIC